MNRVRRTAYLFVYLDSSPVLDLSSLIQSAVDIKQVERIFAISILAAKEHPISVADLTLLRRVPVAEWVTRRSITKGDRNCERRLDGLIERGLVLSERKDPLLSRMRLQDEKLSTAQWNVYAALYHYMSKWSDMSIGARAPKNFDEMAELLVSKK